jgi:hypothetical protein
VELMAKAAVELTVMAKACSSKGRSEVAETTMKAIDALRGHVEVRSTAPDSINGTKQGTCSVIASARRLCVDERTWTWSTRAHWLRGADLTGILSTTSTQMRGRAPRG